VSLSNAPENASVLRKTDIITIAITGTQVMIAFFTSLEFLCITDSAIRIVKAGTNTG